MALLEATADSAQCKQLPSRHHPGNAGGTMCRQPRSRTPPELRHSAEAPSLQSASRRSSSTPRSPALPTIVPLQDMTVARCRPGCRQVTVGNRAHQRPAVHTVSRPEPAICGHSAAPDVRRSELRRCTRAMHALASVLQGHVRHLALSSTSDLNAPDESPWTHPSERHMRVPSLLADEAHPAVAARSRWIRAGIDPSPRLASA